jgi:hypothetical protein
MATKLILSFFLFCFLYTGCSSEKPEEAKSLPGGNQASSVLTTSTVPSLTNDFLVSIYEDQELIKIVQEDKELRQRYCDKAYLKEHNLFITMGIGSLKNPETGQPIPRHLAERAANMDARRWASYGETWLKNNYEPAFGKIESHFNRSTELVTTSIIGDSIFVFIATRLGE